MHLHVVKRRFIASTWRLIYIILLLIIGAVILGQIIDEIVAKILTFIMRRFEYFEEMDVFTFHQLRYPYELLIVTLVTLPTMSAIFIIVYVFSPALCVLLNTAFISLIHVTEYSTRSPSRDLQNNIRDSKKKLRLSLQNKTARGLGMMTVHYNVR